MTTTPLFELSTREAAAKLGFSPDTVKRWAADGKLRHWRTPGGYYRFASADIDAFLEAAEPKSVA